MTEIGDSYGRPYSKITKINSIKSGATKEEVREFREREKEIKERYIDNTFDAIISYWSERAVDILKAKNLPYKAWLYWLEGNDQWQADRPTDTIFFRSSSLSHHIIKELGYPHDSTEGLVARMLSIIDRLETAKDKDALLLAHEFGKVQTLLYVYSSIDNQCNDIRPKNKRKKWADDLAEYLVEKYMVDRNLNFSFTEYWDAIPEDNDELLHCYRQTKEGKDYLCYSKFGGDDDKISRETFRTEYIPVAKKTLREK